ncbi:muscle M-line assembly protein unc-89-like isoform X3 [Mya arenaria]|uniref:muscle M-line assembly protein unc-89-like isoform X3 n=1 Tax=Mya arenaria TaxID=6604 RepID=UPI0022E34558|nr:muscle M-line assembly protein unc-89-like isoform X3 [Mya arenaria]
MEIELAACKDYRERQNIRSALRELKGIQLDGNSIVAYSFDPKNVKKVDRQTNKEGTKSTTQKQWSALRIGVLDEIEDRNYTLNKYFETSSGAHDNHINGLCDYETQESNEDKDFCVSSQREKHTDENANLKNVNEVIEKRQSFRTYLYAGTVGSPKNSPRSTKDEIFRAKKVNILRVKNLDKSDLQDKSTGTEDGFVNLSKTDDENDEKVLEDELRNAVGVITPSKWKSPKNDNKGLESVQCVEEKCLKEEKLTESRSVLDLINEFESQEPSNCDKNVVRVPQKNESHVFDKGKNRENKKLEKHSKQDEQHCDNSGPVNCEVSSQNDNAKTHSVKSPKCQNNNSPRKPKKIVSYRTSAFSSTSKLNPISSSVSRLRLQSAPPTVTSQATNKSPQEHNKLCDTMKEITRTLNRSVLESEVNPRSEANSTLSGKPDIEFDEVFIKNMESNNLTPRKKVGLVRKNRVESDEKNFLKKYQKKSKDRDVKLDECENVPKLETIIDTKNAVNDKSAKNATKIGSVRRKLPDIPLKKESDNDDDESVHQRTLRLLQERKQERLGKLHADKDKNNVEKEKQDKGKMTPADLKKTLEQKLERSESKKKAMRVRRELQLLDRENESKAPSLSRSSSANGEIGEPDNLEIINILSQPRADKMDKDSVKNMKRSKSDVICVRRAVSESDTMFGSVNLDQAEEQSDPRVMELVNSADPRTALERINLIGTLMQEEARIQNLLRKSSNFSEKRQMRADVRRLRQRRTALESGTEGESGPVPLRRAVSVTGELVHTSQPPEQGFQGNTVDDFHDQEQHSIEKLRRQLGETQDYDEKKKIRLALRQLRQQTRDGGLVQTGLQRSQSFVQQKSCEPVSSSQANGLLVGRSHSVIDKHSPSTSCREVRDKGETVQNKTSKLNGFTHEDIPVKSRFSSEELKPPRPKSSITVSSKSQSCELNADKPSRHSLKDNTRFDTDGKLRYNGTERSDLKIKENRKKFDDYQDQKRATENRGKGFSLKSSNKTDEIDHRFKVKSAERIKPTEVQTEPLLKLDDQKQNSFKERCNIFENAENSVNVEGESVEISRHRTPSVLVSRASVEKSKQEKLVNVRRVRSFSAEPRGRWDRNSDRTERYKDKTDGTVNDINSRSRKTKDIKDKRENCDISVKLEKRVNKKADVDRKDNVLRKDFDAVDNYVNGKVESQQKNNLTADVDDNTRLSPSLQWLEEKRKSLTTPSDVDKLMSTMDIEQAFSEILDAVDKFPEEKALGEPVISADIPILEEELGESSEMEEDLNKNKKSEPNLESSLSSMSDNSAEVELITKGMDKEQESDVTVEPEVEEANGAIQEEAKKDGKKTVQSSLTLAMPASPDANGAISVIQDDDGTVTVQEVSRTEEGNTVVTEYKRVRRTKSKTETREKDMVVERKITSPGGTTSVYEKDISKSKRKLTSRGSEYFNRNNINIRKTRDLEGTEIVEHKLSSLSENVSVSKNESWGDRTEAEVTLNRELENDVVQLPSSNQDNEAINNQGDVEKPTTNSGVIKSHLGRPSGCPEIISPLKEAKTTEESCVTLECTVVSSPVPTVTWYKGDNCVTAGHAGIDAQYDIESGKATLMLLSSTVGDSGTYRCVFENPIGTASTKCLLQVRKRATEMPSFVKLLSDVEVREGQALSLECQVANTDTVTWFKDGTLQRNNPDFRQTLEDGRARMEMAEVFLDDYGTYCCVINNDHGEQKCSCQVTVKECESYDEVYPMFLKKPETQIADERDTVIFECEVIGSPRPEVSWIVNGNKLVEGARHRMSYDGRVAMLVIRKVVPAESGKVECTVENSSGKVAADCMLVVQAMATCPSITMPLSDLTVSEGNNVFLECGIQGQPVPEVTWRKNGMVIGHMLDFKQTFADGLARLVISKSCMQDSGRYECMATSLQGETSTSCHLTVTAAAPEPNQSEVKEFPSIPTIPPPSVDAPAEENKVKEEIKVLKKEKKDKIEKQNQLDAEVKATVEDTSPSVKVPNVSTPKTEEIIVERSLFTITKMEVDTPTKEEIVVERPTSIVKKTEVKTLPKEEFILEKPPTINKNQEVKTPYKNKVIVEKPPSIKKVSEEENPAIMINQEIEYPNKNVFSVEKPSIRKVIEENPAAIKTVVEEKHSVIKKSQMVKTPNKNEIIVSKPPSIIKKSAKDRNDNNNEVPVTVSVQQNALKAPLESKHVVAEESLVQKATVKSFPDKFVPKTDEDTKLAVKTQASKIMLVRQASLRNLGGEQKPVALKRSGSLQSMNAAKQNGENKAEMKDSAKVETKVSVATIQPKTDIADLLASKPKEDTQNNLKEIKGETVRADTETNATEIGGVKAKTVSDESKANVTLKTDNLNSAAGLSSLCLESADAEKPKPFSKFRSNEIRRTQSVKAPGNEKPEWLQVKLKRVGSNKKPYVTSCTEKEEPPAPISVGVEKPTPVSEPVQPNIPSVSVHKNVKLSRSQSARVAVCNTPNALKDSTNNPVYNPAKDSVKLTPVSERARIFQVKDNNSTPSGKQSPVDIIAKAINLSRAESMRSPAGQRPITVQRSSSLKTEVPQPANSQSGDVTLELTPQKIQGEGEVGSAGRSKPIKYWDPTAPSDSTMDYSKINDEEELGKLLSSSDNFDERKKIRGRIKEVRDAHMKEWEAKRVSREKDTEDLIKKKHREADLEKQRKLEAFSKQAAQHTEAKHLDMNEQHLREKHRLADEKKKRQLDEYSSRQAVHQDSKHLEISEKALQERIKQADTLKQKTMQSYDKAAGKDPALTVTAKTKTGAAAGRAADEIAPQLAQQIINATQGSPVTGGVISVKTESWSSKDGITRTSEKTESWGGRGGAMNAFKQMDAKNNPTNAGAGAANKAMMRSPSAIKTMLLEWTKAMTREYIDTIEITNFSTSWNDGMAFCALIHHFYPEAFDFKALNPKQRRKNFELAFDTAEKYADIAPLLDVEDMVRMQKPDWKCVFTYVQSFYRKLRDHDMNKCKGAEA